MSRQLIAEESTITVGIAQWLPDPGQPSANLTTALGILEELAPGCDLVVFPELWSCGYDARSLVDDVRRSAQPLNGSVLSAVSEAARRLKIYVVPGSVPERDGSNVYNTAVLISDEGRILARHRKAHLYGEPERAAFQAGDCLTVCTTPFGVVGLSICFDGDFPEVARAMRRKGARLVVNPAAYDYPAEQWWDRLFPAHALTNGQTWILANQAGSHGETTFFGRSQVISPAGTVIAEAMRAVPGRTPPLDSLVVELPQRAPSSTDVLFDEARPELPVHSYC